MLSRLSLAELSPVLEPFFLRHLSTTLHDASNAERAYFLSLARSSHADFCIVYEGLLPLLYHCYNLSPQFILFAGNGFY